MAIYIIFIIILLILWKLKVKTVQGITFLGCLMILMLSLRSIELGYTDTKYIYYEAFNRFKTFSSIATAINDAHFRNEPLMAIYIYIFAKLFGSFRLFLIVSAMFSLIPVIQLIKKNNKTAYLAILYFFSFYYFFYMYLIKQMIALSIIIIAFNASQQKKLIKFICMCLLASSIHKFAWPCLIIYPICNYIQFKRKTYILITVIIIAGLMFPKTLVDLIIKIDPTGLMSTYINIYNKNTSLNLGIFLNIFILIFCALMRNKIKINQENYNALLILSSINCILNSYSLIITEFQRLAFFFGIYNSILLPKALESLPIKQQYKTICVYFIVTCLIIYGLGRTAINTQCLPYKFLWID